VFSNWKHCNIILSNNEIQLSINPDAWKKVIDILWTYHISKVTFLGWKSQYASVLKHCFDKGISVSIEVSAIEFIKYPKKYKSVLSVLNIVLEPDELKFVVQKLPLHRTVNITFLVSSSNSEKIVSALEKVRKLKSIDKARIRVLNYTEAKYSSFWKNRVFKKNAKFKTEDRIKLQKMIKKIKKNKKKYKIVNSNRYLDMISYYGITQNWKCKYWDSPTIAPDGCLMVCKDRFLIKPISIFDLNDRESEKKLMATFIETSKSCSGCFQEDKVESEIRIRKRKVEGFG